MLQTIEAYLDEHVPKPTEVERQQARMVASDENELFTIYEFDDEDFDNVPALKCRLRTIQSDVYEKSFREIGALSDIVLTCVPSLQNRPIITDLANPLMLSEKLEDKVIVLPLYRRKNGYVDSYDIPLLRMTIWSMNSGKLILERLDMIDLFICGKRHSPSNSFNARALYRRALRRHEIVQNRAVDIDKVRACDDSDYIQEVLECESI